jgi:hypothetical protein
LILGSAALTAVVRLEGGFYWWWFMMWSWPSLNYDFLTGGSKKEIDEAPRGGGAASGAFIEIGGTDAPTSSQTVQETTTYSPTFTTTNANQYSTTSTYSPVYAPSVSMIYDSPNASIMKKDEISGAGVDSSPLQYLPIDSGGTAVMPTAGALGGSDALSPLGRLVDSGPALVLVVGVVAVGGLILYARTGGRK